MSDAQTPTGPKEYRTLKERFNRRGFEYRLVKRSEHIAMFEQWADGRLHAWEVFRIQRNDARVIGGKAVAASESPPSDEMWGKRGWTLLSLDAAEARYEAAHAALEEAAADDAETDEAVADEALADETEADETEADETEADAQPEADEAAADKA